MNKKKKKFIEYIYMLFIYVSCWALIWYKRSIKSFPRENSILPSQSVAGMPTSSTDVSATFDEGFRPPKSSLVSGDTSDFSSTSSSSISGLTQAFHFSSGNPRIEEIRGVVHLFRDDVSSSSSTSSSALPVSCDSLIFISCVSLQ